MGEAVVAVLSEQPATVRLMGKLLDAAFVRELEVLRRSLDIVARSGRSGERLARRRGSSVEFKEHRAYAPGDDLRRIDWAAYARSGEPVLKLFRADEDVVVRVLVDGSASMGFGSPPKLDAAKRLAAAIGYMVLARSERAQLLVATDKVSRWNVESRGRNGLGAFLSSAEDIEAAGLTDLGRAIDSTVKRAARPGMLVVLSDFFDPGALLTALSRAGSAGHDVALVQVLAPEDLAPDFDGDLALEDIETGELVEVTADADALDAYERRLSALYDDLRLFARRHRAAYVRTSSAAPLEPVMRRFVAKDVD